MPTTSIPPPSNVFDDVDDDEGWQDMPVVREDAFISGFDEEDQKKYHYVPSAKGKSAENATGNLIDFDDSGHGWRSKVDQNENDYTRLRVNEEDDADEVHLRTRYLFDEDKAMTPISQMQATKNLLTEAQRIAYVGLCALTSREMSQSLKLVHRKELKAAVTNMELWAMKIMGRLYYHMELETAEQKMIESLAEHGVQAMDLVPSLMTTHTVANPEYDPEEARRKLMSEPASDADDESISDQTLVDQPISKSPVTSPENHNSPTTLKTTPVTQFQTTARVLQDTATSAIPGVSTSLSAADKDVTLDIRWTVLCDLFLLLIADSVYDARSRVLLEHVAQKLGLGWIDVVKFESRVTEALEIQEDVERLEQQDIVEGVRKAGKRRRYMMLGLATLGGGLVIGLSAGLLAPVIGAGLAGAFTTIGVTGTGAFLGGTAGAAVITTGGVLTGSGIAVRGMANRTKQVRTFDILPLHNNKRVSCILTVPGFMTGLNDDVRLPFSVLDPIVGDVFSVLWEPEMIRETGSALKILTGEVLSQIGLTVLQATAMTTLMSALQWPIILTKLGYLIDNPWSNALDRAKAAGRVLADVLIQRHLGVRPITLIGFSLGARVIFYALLELAKQKQFGIVQDVFLLGATLTVSASIWCDARSVVSGRFVNAFARNDWVLNYLFRASSGGVGTVAGLRPVQNVPGLENVDVTDKISGHMSYRTFMPLILDQLGFPVFSDFFDEPVEPDFKGDRIVVSEEKEKEKKSWFSRKKSKTTSQNVSRPPSGKRPPSSPGRTSESDDLPPRLGSTPPTSPRRSDDASAQASSGTSTPTSESAQTDSQIPMHAGFDLEAMQKIVGNVQKDETKLSAVDLEQLPLPPTISQATRSQSTPPVHSNQVASSSRSFPPEYAPKDKSHESSREDLSASFTRSVSLNDMRNVEDEDENHILNVGSEVREPLSTSSSLQDSTQAHTPRPSHKPLSLPDEDPPIWSAPSSINLSTPSEFSSPLSYAPPSFQNPFASSLTLTSSSGLSFGGADGTITGQSSSDPWRIPNDFKAKNSTRDFSSNPWS